MTLAGRSASRRMKYGYHSRPYGHVDPDPVAGLDELLLQVAPDAVEHLELEPIAPDPLVAGQARSPPGSSAGRGWPGPAASLRGAAGPSASRYDWSTSAFVREGDRRRLAVGTLAQPDRALLGDQGGDVRGAPAEGGLDHDPTRRVERAQVAPQGQGRVGSVVVLHVDPDEGAVEAAAFSKIRATLERQTSADRSRPIWLSFRLTLPSSPRSARASSSST